MMMMMTNSSSNTKEEEEDMMRTNTAKAVAKAAVANATSTSTSTSTSTHSKKIQLKLKLQLQSGIPPWHTIIALFIILFLFIIPNLPTKKSLDEYSTIEVITKCKFPMYLSLKGLAYIRLSIGIIALSLTIYLYFSNGWEFYPNYIKKYTKLQHIKLHLYRFGTLCPFTSVSWLILGVGFLLRGIICLASASSSYDVVYNEDDNDDNSNSNANANNNNFIIIIITNYILKENTWLLRITFILWELTGPYAVLTSTVIKYVIWPAALRAGPADSPHNLAGWRNQLQHNCNSIFSLLEVTLLGGIPVSLHHITLPIFVGCIYMILTWILGILYYFNSSTLNNTTTKGNTNSKGNTNTNTNKVVVGPQYIYFFMDTSMGIMTTYCMIGLLLAMMIIYILFSLVIKILNTDTDTDTGGGDNDVEVEGKDSLLANITFFITGILLVCRFRN